MEGGNNNNNNSKREKEEIVDVRSVVEAVSANDADIAPLYQLESLCMRCHQNVLSLSLSLSFSILRASFSFWITTTCYHFETGNHKVPIDINSTFSKGTMKFNLRARFNLGGVATALKSLRRLNRQVVKSESATIKVLQYILIAVFYIKILAFAFSFS
ncbi:hypothetical protein CFP56_023320 [Quercus suber]|uniref:Uncharacterized protein n=1 Tax=Quercus suber TaxID=58331 RepID=A0AAW0KAQ6_QUESU